MNWTALGKGFLVAIGMQLVLAVVIAWAHGMTWISQTYGPWAAVGAFSLTLTPIVTTLVYKSEAP